MRLVLALALLAAPGTAWAAKGDVNCVAERLGEAAMTRIGQGVVTAADSGGDASKPLDADRDSLLAAREECRKANGWSPEATLIAVSYLQARATHMGAQAALKADRVDLAGITANFAALPVADRRSLLGQIAPAARMLVMATSDAPAIRRHVLLYFSALAAIEFYPADFAAA